MAAKLPTFARVAIRRLRDWPLRARAALFVATGGLVVALAVYVALRVQLSEGMHSLQEEERAAVTRTLRQWAHEQTQTLAAVVNSYSCWDDAYAFAQSREASFAETNVAGHYATQIDADYFAYVTIDGELLAAAAANHEDAANLPLGQFVAHLSRWSASAYTAAPKETHVGFVWADGTSLAVAMAPVLPSSCEGESLGWVVFARAMGPARLERVSTLTQRPGVSLGPPSPPAAELQTNAELPLGAEPSFAPGKLAIPLQPLVENWERPLTLAVSSPQRVAAAYREGHLALIWALLGIGVPMGLAIFWAVGLWMRAVERERCTWHLHRRFLRQTGEGVLIVDSVSKSVVYFNPSLIDIIGAPEGLIEGDALLNWLKTAPAFVGLWSNLPETATELCIQLPHTQRTLQVRCELFPGDNNSPQLYFRFSDQTARRRAEEQVRHLAFHDALTGLPNRSQFTERWEASVHAAAEHGEPLALLFVDIDHFKELNDRYGHAAGDAALQEAATRLRACVREGDLVARLGGDEFVVALTGSNGLLQRIEALSAKIVEALRAPMTIPGNFGEPGELVHLSASVGAACFPELVNEPSEVMHAADEALMATKEAGRDNYTLYASENSIREDLRVVEQSLVYALDHNQISLHYQPIFALGAGTIQGVEALVRWHTTELGNLCAHDFLAAAQRTQASHRLTQLIVETALTDFARWTKQGVPLSFVTLNVSAAELSDPSYTRMLTTLADAAGVDRGTIHLDVAEMEPGRGLQRRLQTICALREAGFSLCRDDFGGGTSSLTQLAEIPWQSLKLDLRRLRASAPVGSTNALTAALVEVGHSMRLPVVAEGVEFATEVQLLERLGCEFAQGFALSAPQPAAAIPEVVHRSHDQASGSRPALGPRSGM